MMNGDLVRDSKLLEVHRDNCWPEHHCISMPAALDCSFVCLGVSSVLVCSKCRARAGPDARGGDMRNRHPHRP